MYNTAHITYTACTYRTTLYRYCAHARYLHVTNVHNRKSSVQKIPSAWLITVRCRRPPWWPVPASHWQLVVDFPSVHIPPRALSPASSTSGLQPRSNTHTDAVAVTSIASVRDRHSETRSVPRCRVLPPGEQLPIYSKSFTMTA